MLLTISQLRVMIAHHLNKYRNQFVHERPVHTQFPHETTRATQDPTQHIAAPLVAHQATVRDGETQRTHMIRDHPVGDVDAIELVGDARLFRDLVDDRREQVGLIVRFHALNHTCETFQTGAGIDVSGREVAQFAGLIPEILDEYQVPQLEKTAGLGVRPVILNRGLARGRLAQVEMDFGARPARPHFAHLPEIVLVTVTADVGRVDRGFRFPQTMSLIVIGENGRIELVRRKLEDFRHQLPGPTDRLSLVIVAE
ncbi:hypothetical protein BMS3Bbin04_01243 [bacterium BMS3Bbin04]|nr:hypothetical protein BMS3Bbin04_01243 [bacterium BMS3Bbin04]